MATASQAERCLIREILTGYDEDTVDIVWRIVNEKDEQSEYRRIFGLFSGEAEPEWAYFIVIHNQESEILAIKCDRMNTTRVIDQRHLTRYDVNDCIGVDSEVYFFRVTKPENGNFVAEMEIRKDGEPTEFEESRYVGIMRLSLPGIMALMGMLAWKSRAKRFRRSGYYRDFVQIYYIMTGKTASVESRNNLAELDNLMLTEQDVPNTEPEVEETEIGVQTEDASRSATGILLFFATINGIIIALLLHYYYLYFMYQGQESKLG